MIPLWSFICLATWWDLVTATMGHWGLYFAASFAVRPVVVMEIMAEAWML